MLEVKAEIITIGDELLYGQIADTNSQWICSALDEVGIRVRKITSLPDQAKAIRKALKEAAGHADLVLITGGLGPTKDDITKKVLSDFLNSPLQLNQEALEEITALFASRGREMTELNKKQAELPAAAIKIRNRLGTAPAMWMESDGTVFVSMPGVPYEMKTIVTEELTPRIVQHFQLPSIYHRVIRTIGIGESWLSELIEDWEDNLPEHIKLAYLPSMGEVKLRLTAFGEDRRQLAEEVDIWVEKLIQIAGKYVYGFGYDPFEKIAGDQLIAMKLTLSTAESCSGGYLSHLLTSIPGSSAYYQGSIVAYSNRIKEEILGISDDLLATEGEVSEACAMAMAKAVQQKFNTDIGLASTGIAGPDGGSEEKPVGLVWIACSYGGEVTSKKLLLTKDRMINIKLTALNLLNLLRKTVFDRSVELS